MLPRLIAFDLDGTIWDPEMYQLWGGGAPFKGDGRGVMTDKAGTAVRLLGTSREVLTELRNDPRWSDTKVAWVSCTDEPGWANELLRKFLLLSGEPIGDAAHSSQIYFGSKDQHFRRLKAEYPDIEYEDMLFFDNEPGNIRTVSKLGVRCVLCPDGVNEDIWRQGLSLFR